MRRILALVCVALALLVAGCSGDVSRATISLGESSRFSRTELQAAADAVLEEFRGFRGCTLLRLDYDEEFSLRQGSLTVPRPSEIAEVVIFTSEFAVDGNGGDGSMTPNSTYTNWTWEVVRTGPDSPWEVTNWGVA